MHEGFNDGTSTSASASQSQAQTCDVTKCSSKLNEYSMMNIPHDVKKMPECNGCPVIYYTDPKLNLNEKKQTIITIYIPNINTDTFHAGVIVDHVPHVFQFTEGKSKQGILHEVSPTSPANSLVMLIYTQNGNTFYYCVPRTSLPTSADIVPSVPTTIEVSGTSVNGTSCGNVWACGSGSLNGVLTPAQISLIGNCAITLTINGNPCTPTTTNTFYAYATQTTSF